MEACDTTTSLLAYLYAIEVMGLRLSNTVYVDVVCLIFLQNSVVDFHHEALVVRVFRNHAGS